MEKLYSPEHGTQAGLGGWLPSVVESCTYNDFGIWGKRGDMSEELNMM